MGSHQKLCCLILLVGCTGNIADPPLAPGMRTPTPGEVQPAPQSRLPRLTHRQWAQSLQDLLALESTPSTQGLRADALAGDAVFDNLGGALVVDDALEPAYQRVASDLANETVADPGRLDLIAPPGQDAASFIRNFGLRVHRRPLLEEEVAEYVELYRRGPEFFAQLEARPAGVHLVLEAMLRSPHFLYRPELSQSENGGTIQLDSYELASRLSYALWGSVPDTALLNAAATDSLREPGGVRVQASRMLDDARASRRVVNFHRQLLDTARFQSITDPAVAASAANEHDNFVASIWHFDEGYRELLTSRRTYVDERLAELYGITEDVPPGGTVEVELDPSRRAGVFTQIGFLASRATQTQPDPIHRGVFLAERIACHHIAAPPDNTPPAVFEGRTNRENIELHTEQPDTVCAYCHAVEINPFGFPFENYGALGAWRETDNGYPVDAAAAPRLDGEEIAVESAVELTEHLAESIEVHRCYALHWIEYLLGRRSSELDRPLIDELGSASLSGASLRELILRIVESPAFVRRSTREVGQL